ncbi:odorant-binding protein-like [Delphinus delphis]|uniref:odorant-binding protein-like n=1 Tax=Delphinus delphis TaxID=9728 RepID=UPI0028C4EE31|nr:odorant-binding protein-like [Delphinus delphis]
MAFPQPGLNRDLLNPREFCFHLSGEWKTLYVASNNPEKTSENGPFKVYMRNIHLNDENDRAAFNFFVNSGRGNNTKEEDFEKFKQMTREEGIPEENTVNVTEAGNRITLFPECILHRVLEKKSDFTT